MANETTNKGYKNHHIPGDLSVSRNANIGGNTTIHGSQHVKGNVKVDGWLEARNIKGSNKGIFQSESKLRSVYPSPLDGWWAIVGNSLPGDIYVGDGGEWVATGGTGGDPEVDIQAVEDIKTQLNSLGYTFLGTIKPTDTPIALKGDEKVFYIATEEGDYSNFSLSNISELSIIKSENGSWKIEGLGVNLEINDAIHTTEDSVFYVVDKDGNIIAKINNEGISTTDVKIKDENGELKSVKDLSPSLESIDERYNDALYVTDSDGNVIIEINKDGVFSPNLPKNDWAGKTMAVYGDSVVAINNGNYIHPFNNIGQKWANYTAAYFNMAKQYGRGIGGQRYAWLNGGGAVSWVTPTGVLINRIDAQNYDDWDGTYPSGVTSEMVDNGSAIRTRGCLSSWHRITHQFPESIKNNIDVVLVMAHNDSYDTDDWNFISNDTTDPEWATSGAEYYGKINGDYNISTLRGGILSTVMKLQLWMPNAIIVLTTGISGQGITGDLLPDEVNRDVFLNIANAVREMGKLSAIPVIDTFANDGINGWNRITYITDTIHPYTVASGKMIARAVIGGLKMILPNF